VTILRTDVSDERVASIIGVKSMLQLLVTANVPSSLIPFALMMEAILSFETSVLTRTTQPHIPEGGILHSHHRDEPQIVLSANLF
jgi:hypothetical protein